MNLQIAMSRRRLGCGALPRVEQRTEGWLSLASGVLRPARERARRNVNHDVAAAVGALLDSPELRGRTQAR